MDNNRIRVRSNYELALQDPHLLKLSDYLAHLEQGGQEDRYKQEYWVEGPTIIKVVDPEYKVQQFVLMWDNQAKDHSSCPFSKLSHRTVEESGMSEKGNTSSIPGLSENIKESSKVVLYFATHSKPLTI